MQNRSHRKCSARLFAWLTRSTLVVFISGADFPWDPLFYKSSKLGRCILSTAGAFVRQRKQHFSECERIDTWFGGAEGHGTPAPYRPLLAHGTARPTHRLNRNVARNATVRNGPSARPGVDVAIAIKAPGAGRSGRSVQVARHRRSGPESAHWSAGLVVVDEDNHPDAHGAGLAEQRRAVDPAGTALFGAFGVQGRGCRREPANFGSNASGTISKSFS